MRLSCDALKHPEVMEGQKPHKRAKVADDMSNVPLPGLLPPGGRPRRRGKLLLRPLQSGAPLRQLSHHGVPPHLPRQIGEQPRRLHLLGRHEPPMPRRGVQQGGRSPANVRLHGKRKAVHDEPGPNKCAAASSGVPAADDVVLFRVAFPPRSGVPTSHILICLVIQLFPLL